VFDQRFINVLDEQPAGPGGTNLTTALAATFDRLRRSTASGPYTLYISRSCSFTGTLDEIAPPSRVTVTWILAPGAVVSLGARAVLQVTGDIELTNGQHFNVADGAEVRLRGPLAGVRPEWFGVSPVADRALRSALAVIVDRFLAGSEQVPLLVSGSYRLSGPVRIDVPRSATLQRLEICVEGRHPYGDRAISPTFVVGAEAAGPDALQVGRGVRVKLRHVAFRSDSAAIAENSGLLTLEGENDGSEIVRCSFFVSHGVGVRVTAVSTEVVREFQPTGFFGEDAKEVARKQSESARWHTVNSFDRLAVSDSWFEYSTDSRSLPSMIRLEGVARAVRLSVDRCAFRGRARAMIAAPAGVLIITSCSFAVESAADGSTGADLLLGSLARIHPGAGAAAPIHLVETHVRTSSVSHLQCERLNGAPDSMVSITGLRHDPVVTATNGSASFIRWDGPIGSGLLLQGCTIAGRVELRSPMDRVVLLATERRGEMTSAEPPAWSRMVP
jgi:hypothetical protein